MGVTRGSGRYRARYTFRGVRYNVGSYATEDEAWIAMGKHKWENNAIPSFEWERPPDSIYRLNRPKPTLIQRVKKWLKERKAS